MTAQLYYARVALALVILAGAGAALFAQASSEPAPTTDRDVERTHIADARSARADGTFHLELQLPVERARGGRRAARAP